MHNTTPKNVLGTIWPGQQYYITTKRGTVNRSLIVITKKILFGNLTVGIEDLFE